MNAVTKHEAQTALPADPMVNMIEKVMLNADLPMERITAIMDMRERQMNKEAEQAFNRDFAAAMAEMPDVPRSGENKHLKTFYSTLDDLIRTTRPVLARHGLSLNWQTETGDREVKVTAIVRHAMGHQITDTQAGPKDNGKQMNALQGGGSTTTYLKRYTGFGILGLSSGSESDDDGVGSSAPSTVTEQQFVEISKLMDAAGVVEDVVLDAEKISALHFLPSDRFEPLARRLRATIAKNEAKE